jgi:hypothetical protein
LEAALAFDEVSLILTEHEGYEGREIDLERCWRDGCKNAVQADDPIGLCEGCRFVMSRNEPRTRCTVGLTLDGELRPCAFDEGHEGIHQVIP